MADGAGSGRGASGVGRWRETPPVPGRTAWTRGTACLSPFHRVTALTQWGPACLQELFPAGGQRQGDGWCGLPAPRSCRGLVAWEFGCKSKDFAQNSELCRGTWWLHDGIRQLEALSFIMPGIRRIYEPKKILRK